VITCHILHHVQIDSGDTTAIHYSSKKKAIQ